MQPSVHVYIKWAPATLAVISVQGKVRGMRRKRRQEDEEIYLRVSFPSLINRRVFSSAIKRAICAEDSPPCGGL